ncbi:MAG: phosphotransferase [Gammaproteobacteria bacterium]|nr:phosphotransferase [Gammaproteobacteria bacterium]
MLNRQDTLYEWLSHDCQLHIDHFHALPGDASFRRYYRLTGHLPGQSTQHYIVMDAPTTHEKTNIFIDVAHLFKNFGLRVPEIIQQNSQDGFLLLEDFGDTLLLGQLNSQSVNHYYHLAMDILIQLQTQAIENKVSLPAFDQTFILQELQLFNDWFVKKHLQIELSSSEEDLLMNAFLNLSKQINAMSKTVIHRDFHSRNLMILNDDSLGIIDFQDAMIGPRTYDLVSILKDCYISWDVSLQKQWCYDFYKKLNISTDFNLFLREFTLCGLQRHLKVLGIFARLNYRDGKHQYLNDLPLVWHYMMEALGQLDEFQAFHHWIQERIAPIFEQQASIL